MPIIAKATNPRPIICIKEAAFAEWLKGEGRPPHWQKWIKAHDFTAKSGQVLILPSTDGGVEAALLGSSGDDFTDGANSANLPPMAWEADKAEESFALGFALAQYRFDRFRIDKADPLQGAEPSLLIRGKTSRKRVNAIASGINWARDLINMPANILTPQGLEEEARDLADSMEAKIKVIKGEALDQGFPAIAVVGRGAEHPPRLLDVHWGEEGPLITLIGKGVTFDSGGLDIKPSSAMVLMKKDMGGAAIVLGLAKVIMMLGLNIRLRVLIPVAENAISATAFRPLDVIETAAGIPVEVGNTDAEGRLMLADALHYAGEDTPKMMIDFATLTGAARVALGTELPALFSNDKKLMADFITASEAVGDPLWAMPLHKPYDRHLDAGYTALSSTGTVATGGAITAALFLERFVKPTIPWAHIDVMAWNSEARPGHPKGGEAMGLRAALQLIDNLRLQAEATG